MPLFDSLSENVPSAVDGPKENVPARALLPKRPRSPGKPVGNVDHDGFVRTGDLPPSKRVRANEPALEENDQTWLESSLGG
jgi:hypothetical protein